MPKADPTENDFIKVDKLRASHMLDVSGKIVLVTGGGSGIGAMISAGFVANGAHVIIASRKDTSAWASKLTESGSGTCISVAGINLTKDEDCVKLAKFIEDKFGKLNCLVNNSGTNWSDSFLKYPSSAFDKVFALNTRAPFVLTQKCHKLLKEGATKENPSSVINIGSINGKSVPGIPTFAYSSSKAAVIHLTKHLAPTLGRANITCNCICPGPFMSRMMRQTLKIHPVHKTTCLDRIGSPEDMAGICIYFASRAGAFCTGTSIDLDGGALCKTNAKM